MPLRLGALHDALLHPGDAELAKRAAEELANDDNQLADIRGDLRVLKGMMGFVLAFLVAHFWLSFSILSRLPR